MTPTVRSKFPRGPFFVTADDIALIGGAIEAGDQLLIDPKQPVTDGAYALVDTAAGRFVAKVRHQAGRLCLDPVSPNLFPMVLKPGASFPMYRIVSVSKPV